MKFIPQIEPWIDNAELDQLKRVIDNGYVTENKLTEEFEDKIKSLTGSKFAVSITNGTVALYCCLKALEIGLGDEVIVPNLTFIATSNSVLMANAKPVFCEIDKQTLCIDPYEIENLINSKTKAIMPVHLYGQSADMVEIVKIAKKYNLYIIEDAAQGVGVKFNSKHVGTFGDMGVLSFYGNKTITCGEGGIVLTEDNELRDRVYRLKNHGRLTKGTFDHDSIGYNYAFTEMQAAIGISQLNKLPSIIRKKNDIHKIYHSKLDTIQGELTKIYLDKRTVPVWWFTSFLAKQKNELKNYLIKHNIQTRDFFRPLNLQKCYEKYNTNGNFKVSQNVYEQGISLPSSFNLSVEQQDYIINIILEYYDRPS